jgi:DNA-binding NtrC family response regulator
MSQANIVVLVEDDRSLRSVLRDLLKFTGHTVVECCDAQQALTLADRQAGSVSTMIIDYAIPGLSGLALAREMRRIAPWVKLLIMSGHRSVETECRCEHGFAFLPKPFGTADVLQALEKIEAERTKLPKRATGVYPASPALAFTMPRAAGA